MSAAKLVLENSILLMLVWVVWHYIWRNYWLDVATNRLYAVRDELFAMAADNTHGLTFDHPAYKALRPSINASIHCVGRLSGMQVWLALVIACLSRSDVWSHVSEAKRQIDAAQNPNLKNKLAELRNREASIVTAYLLKTSPVSIALACSTALAMILSVAIQVFIKRKTVEIREVQARTEPCQHRQYIFANTVKAELKRKEDETAAAVLSQTEAFEETDPHAMEPVLA